MKIPQRIRAYEFAFVSGSVMVPPSYIPRFTSRSRMHLASSHFAKRPTPSSVENAGSQAARRTALETSSASLATCSSNYIGVTDSSCQNAGQQTRNVKLRNYQPTHIPKVHTYKTWRSTLRQMKHTEVKPRGHIGEQGEFRYASARQSTVVSLHGERFHTGTGPKDFGDPNF